MTNSVQRVTHPSGWFQNVAKSLTCSGLEEKWSYQKASHSFSTLRCCLFWIGSSLTHTTIRDGTCNIFLRAPLSRERRQPSATISCKRNTECSARTECLLYLSCICYDCFYCCEIIFSSCWCPGAISSKSYCILLKLCMYFLRGSSGLVLLTCLANACFCYFSYFLFFPYYTSSLFRGYSMFWHT